MIGCIIGIGINVCYVECVDVVYKWDELLFKLGEMVIDFVVFFGLQVFEQEIMLINVFKWVIC